MNNLEYALECIVWYNCHYEWLEPLADELEKTLEYYRTPFGSNELDTEKHFIWMLLVGMFGNWGTSINSGWIEKTKECAEFIRNLCAKAKGEGENE